jgi:hypothetical protein
MNKLHIKGAIALAVLAFLLMFNSQPDLAEKWEYLASKYQSNLDNRDVYIDPAELVKYMNDDGVSLQIFDLSNESSWNNFHLTSAKQLTIDEIPFHRDNFTTIPGNGILVLMSDKEDIATTAWKHIMAMSETNVYILEGGKENWLQIYDTHRRNHTNFSRMQGERHHTAYIDDHHAEHRNYTPKVKLLVKTKKSGGCG